MSKLEQLAYKLEPAGHEEQPRKRKYEKPDNKLEATFLQFLEKWDKDCIAEEKLVKGSKCSVAEMHSLLLAYQDHKKFDFAGFFVSAVYNQVPDKTIIFDLKLATPVNNIGLCLRKDKILINRSHIGDYFGEEAEGMIINEGTTGNDMGRKAKGPIINLGETDFNLGYCAKGAILNYDCAGTIGSTHPDMDELTQGPIINYGTAGRLGVSGNSLIINLGEAGEKMGESASKSSVTINYGTAGAAFGTSSRGIVLALKPPKSYGAKTYAKLAWTAEDCKEVPKLAKYLKNLQELFEKGRKDYRIALEVLNSLGPKPNIRIQKEIEQIVKEAGYEFEN